MVSADVKAREGDKVVALAGNPNVGKSTLFNALTGMKQHTGNWAGKTVSNAAGRHKNYIFVDIPGTYSLMAHSAEEEVARDFICFGKPDAVVAVCDSTCLERNLNLVLQIIETGRKVIVCLNLADEAKRKRIHIDVGKIEKRLGVPVIQTVARDKNSIEKIISELDKEIENEPIQTVYSKEIEDAISKLEPYLEKYCTNISSRWAALKLLDDDEVLTNKIIDFIGADNELKEIASALRNELNEKGIDSNKLKDIIVSSIVAKAEDICDGAVVYNQHKYSPRDRKTDKILTSKLIGYPIMIFMLGIIFWITMEGANYPSALLSKGLFFLQDKIYAFLVYIGLPTVLCDALVFGVYRVVAWVVSVMLPPMAIFFPLFTLLEDVGYLPRVAYNLDKPFKCCNACGKQSLTMCMGFGCNAVGITGCRIIDSPRERLLAILTNSFVPCNGRFPLIITMITVFLVGSGMFSSVLSALIMTGVILLSVAMTFVSTKLLSKTLIKGVPSSFTLELPPYRKPQICKVIIRSLFDRTVFVLGRAVAVAAPAGLVIWVLANVMIGDMSLLSHISAFLDPLGRLMGLDGVILIAFILGFPANEIVVPIMIMAYTAGGSLSELGTDAMKMLFIQKGWTPLTAVCVLLFSLMHWPCSTSLITVKKETGSIKWTLVAALLPTAFGVISCILVNLVGKALGA